MTVITGPIRCEEPSIGKLAGQALRGCPVCGEVAICHSRQKIERCLAETVREPERVSQPYSNTVLCRGLQPGVRALVLRLHILNQEGRAAVQPAAKKVDSALGIIPILHNNKFQLFVK